MIPVGHAALRLSEKATIRLALKHRNQRRERRLGVPDKPDLDWIAQSDPVRLHVDLHAARLAWLRVIFEPRHGRADDEYGIAVFHRPRRRRRSEMANAARRERRMVCQHRLAE